MMDDRVPYAYWRCAAAAAAVIDVEKRTVTITTAIVTILYSSRPLHTDVFHKSSIERISCSGRSVG